MVEKNCVVEPYNEKMLASFFNVRFFIFYKLIIMQKRKAQEQWKFVYKQKENTVYVNDFNNWKMISISWEENKIDIHTEKTRITACFIQEKNKITSLKIEKYIKKQNEYLLDGYVSMQVKDIQVLTNFLEFLLKNDLNSLSNKKIQLWEKLEINDDIPKTISLMIKDEKWYSIIKQAFEENITDEDIVCIWYRKKQLEIFKNMLEQKESDEKKRQDFLEKNSWILWYWLDYRYLWILQREWNVGISTINWSNSPEVDFLMGCNKFTVLVELKTPETKLFGNEKNRADSWTLSKDLIKAHSQILAQKANREIISQNKSKNFDSKGNPIKQETIDPETILIIWNSKEFTWDNLDTTIKRKTFELFRRNIKNITILTYDELYDRAKFIVYGNNN